MKRRSFLGAAAAALSLPLLPARGWASTNLALGAGQINILSDGNLVLPGDFILGDMPAAETAEILARYGLGTGELTPPCNVTLYQDGTNTVLFDVGAGHDFQPSAGKLMEAFETLGLTVEDVTHVLFTHAHPDHLWGLLDEFDEPMFPNAQYAIGQAEFDYWMNPETVNTIGQSRTTFAVGAQRRLAILADQLTFFQDGDEVLPGIAARMTAGHTPGHMSFELRNGSDSALVVGDAISNHHVAFERPQWASGSDQNADQAAQTRVSLLDQIATEKMTLIGFHLPNGGIGRAEKGSDGYRFVAD